MERIVWLLTLTGMFGFSALTYPQPKEKEPAALTFPPLRGTHLVLPVEVIDGDTIRFFYLIEGTARLYGINAPESTGAEKQQGLEAKKFLANHLPDVPVKAVFMGKEKYGRALISIFTSDGKDLSEVMVDAGHAAPYFGVGPRPIPKEKK